MLTSFDGRSYLAPAVLTLGIGEQKMFDFLKPKTISSPEEFGMALAEAFGSIWFQKIEDRANELIHTGDFSREETYALFHVLLMLHCTAISVGLETIGLEETSKKVVLDSFWNSVANLLREDASIEEAQTFERNTGTWYTKIKEMMLEPSTQSGGGNLGAGKELLQMAVPNRNVRENLDMVDELSVEFASTFAALSKFATDSVKRTKLTKPIISYE